VEVIVVKMKLIAVTLLVLLVELACGDDRPTECLHEPPKEAKTYGVVLPGLNPLSIHKLRSCGKEGTNGIARRAWMGPCSNSKHCQIPNCCGIISGENSTFQIEFEAVTPLKGGVFNGNFDGFCIGDENDESNCTEISVSDLIGQVTVPSFVAGYSHDLCSQTSCNQKPGRVYNLTIPFRFITPVGWTVGIKNNFVSEILTTKKERALCYGLWASLENINVGKKIGNVVGAVGSGKLLNNPVGTLGENVLQGVVPDNLPSMNTGLGDLGGVFNLFGG